MKWVIRGKNSESLIRHISGKMNSEADGLFFV